MTHAKSPNEPDDLDRHLSRFFQAQVPTPFPQTPAVGYTDPARALAGGHASSGRFALAASVALLGGMALWVSGEFVPGRAIRTNSEPPSPSLLKSAEASGSKLLPRTAPTPARGVR